MNTYGLQERRDAWQDQAWPCGILHDTAVGQGSRRKQSNSKVPPRTCLVGVGREEVREIGLRSGETRIHSVAFRWDFSSRAYSYNLSRWLNFCVVESNYSLIPLDGFALWPQLIFCLVWDF